LHMAMAKKGMAAGKMVKKPVAAPIKKKKK
jgi:hypothetical protein